MDLTPGKHYQPNMRRSYNPRSGFAGSSQGAWRDYSSTSGDQQGTSHGRQVNFPRRRLFEQSGPRDLPPPPQQQQQQQQHHGYQPPTQEQQQRHEAYFGGAREFQQPYLDSRRDSTQGIAPSTSAYQGGYAPFQRQQTGAGQDVPAGPSNQDIAQEFLQEEQVRQMILHLLLF